ncbi:hypothetical protein Taro_055994 [Colocasia esculenta]|uniref:Uncharacterized protein n=1 Tax=Colocasia esculenta TaxID=4460 RepID=A0A843XVY4_COLES|nr:hypothetical protein [Colocasia esculenta]
MESTHNTSDGSYGSNISTASLPRKGASTATTRTTPAKMAPTLTAPTVIHQHHACNHSNSKTRKNKSVGKMPTMGVGKLI